MHQHAIDRARERYGVELTLPMLQMLEAQCRHDQPPCIARRRGKEIRMIEFDGVTLKAVWLPKLGDNGRIITFLAPDQRPKELR